MIEAAFLQHSSGVVNRATSAHRERLASLRQSMAQVWEAGGNEIEEGVIEDLALEAAEALAKEHGSEAAGMAYRLAIQPDKLTLREALTERHKGATTREQTKAAEVKALDALLLFLNVADCLPEAVTDKRASAYVDSLNAGKLAHATKKGRLSCLGRLWAMKKVKAQLPERAPNPWQGHDVKGQRRSTEETDEETGRNWTEAEMVKVFAAPDPEDKRRRTYTRPLFRQLYAVGLITGMRLDEITSLRPLDVTSIAGGIVLNVRKAKTDAGVRSIPVVHPAVIAILKGRARAQTDPKGMIFPECVPGGPDNKTSWHVSKAMGKDRVKLALTEVTFHSTRGTFMALQENAGTNVVHVQRYVGHVIDTVMHKDYSGGSTVETLTTIAKAVRYPDRVEAELALVRHPASLDRP
jgi:integrase